MIDKLRGAIVAAVLLAIAGPAAALGLGQIQVKSRLDQPLLAEIPIISNDPAELEQLQARLASPETFRRIGLEPPSGIAADLQFSVALDARGNPVIRVTSTQPVHQPLVSFLVEVDWGQGRLVREYSALLDTPNTVSAPAQPPIEAPVAAPSNVIEQPVAAPVAVEPDPVPDPELPAEAAQEPQPEPTPVVAAPPPAASAPAVAAPTPVPVDPGQLQVERGDTLSELAAGLAAGRDYTLDQTMLALLRANPEAFIGDNINLLKSGAVLRIPDASEVASFSRAEAAAVVRDHVERWQASRAPAPQPAAVAGTAAAGEADSATTDAGGARVAGARLEIAPPTDGGDSPGTRSGTSAGGEGDMLRQEMQAKEDLAARTAEVEELKARVAELEKLQQQQQQLISMKDSELAAAQQRLAATREAGTVPAPEQAQTSATPWLWGGAGLLALGLLAWLFSRRRKPVAESRRSYDTAALAAGMPGGGRADDLFGGAEDAGAEVDADEVAPVEPPRWTGAPSTAAPTWHGGPALGLGAATAVDTADASQKLELARAYLDLGDDDAARAVLREVLDGRDPVARETAAALLRDL